MSTDLFLGGLASLVLAAGIIVALTTGSRGEYPDGEVENDNRKDKSRRSKSDGRPNH